MPSIIAGAAASLSTLARRARSRVIWAAVNHGVEEAPPAPAGSMATGQERQAEQIAPITGRRSTATRWWSSTRRA
jgi:hypothetical protein